VDITERAVRGTDAKGGTALECGAFAPQRELSASLRPSLDNDQVQRFTLAATRRSVPAILGRLTRDCATAVSRKITPQSSVNLRWRTGLRGATDRPREDQLEIARA